jgi:hypothetical protein
MLAVLVLAGSCGFLSATALGTGAADPTRTVTIDVGAGATGPQGPQGPPGPKGDPGPPGQAGSFDDCPAGYELADLVINHPGGHVTVLTCLKT